VARDFPSDCMSRSSRIPQLDAVPRLVKPSSLRQSRMPRRERRLPSMGIYDAIIPALAMEAILLAVLTPRRAGAPEARTAC
jgi:hypothetical protein